MELLSFGELFENLPFLFFPRLNLHQIQEIKLSFYSQVSSFYSSLFHFRFIRPFPQKELAGVEYEWEFFLNEVIKVKLDSKVSRGFSQAELLDEALVVPFGLQLSDFRGLFHIDLEEPLDIGVSVQQLRSFEKLRVDLGDAPSDRGVNVLNASCSLRLPDLLSKGNVVANDRQYHFQNVPQFLLGVGKWVPQQLSKRITEVMEGSTFVLELYFTQVCSFENIVIAALLQRKLQLPFSSGNTCKLSV